MENKKFQENSLYKYQKTDSNKINIKTNYINDTPLANNGFRTKNIFLSLPKIKIRHNKINKSFLKTLNLTLKYQRNRTIDSLSPEIITKYGNTTQTLPNKTKNNFINISIINKRKNYNYPQTNKFTMIIENSQSNKIHPKKILNTNFNNFNTTYKNYIKKQLKPQLKEIPTNKSSDQKFLKSNKISSNKKPPIDYITQIMKNLENYRMREEPNLKLLSVGDLMKMKIQKYNINNKSGNQFEGNNLKTYIKIGSKFSPEEKIKNLEERNEFYKKIQLLNEENKEIKEKKKLFHYKNFKEILNHYKNNRFDNCRKLIEQTLLDVKKEKNTIVKFFQDYKKVFDEFDDWDSPKNKDNLYI